MDTPRSSYQVHGNVVEHVTSPRFHTLVAVHDGQTASIRTIEWIDSRRHVTPVYARFLAANAILAWSLVHLP